VLKCGGWEGQGEGGWSEWSAGRGASGSAVEEYERGEGDGGGRRVDGGGGGVMANSGEGPEGGGGVGVGRRVVW